MSFSGALLKRVRTFNYCDPSRYVPFLCKGDHGEISIVGCVRRENIKFLKNDFPLVFEKDDNNSLLLKTSLSNFAERSAALREVCESLVERGDIPMLQSKDVAVVSNYAQQPQLQVDCSASEYFGVHTFSSFVTAFTSKETTSTTANRYGIGLYVWMRANQKQLDDESDLKWYSNFARDTLDATTPPGDCARQAVEDVAAVTSKMALTSAAVGTVSFMHETLRGMHISTQFLYDLEGPAEWVPPPRNGSDNVFELWSMDDMMEQAKVEHSENTTDRRVDSITSLVFIDFMIRHGIMKPDEHSHYHSLCTDIRPPIEMFYHSIYTK